MIGTPKPSSFVKPLLWGAVSIFSAAYAVQSTVTVRLDAEPALPNSEFESMFHPPTGLVHELKAPHS
jgi:hypothetical protein